MPYLALLGVQVTFGLLPATGKIVLASVPTLGVVGIRVGITALLLFVIQYFRGRVSLKSRGDHLKLFLLSIFGVTLNQLLFIGGLSFTTASNASLLATTIPICAMLVSIAVGNERLRGVKIVGVLTAITGVIILVDPRKASFSSSSTIGDLMILSNSIAYGSYVATSKTVIMRNGAFRSMMWVFIYSSLVCVPLGIYSLLKIDLNTVDPMVWGLIAIMVLISTVVPYLLNAWALAKVEPSVVAVFIYLQPIFGFLFAMLFVGERITFIFVISMLFIFTGLYLVSRKGRPISA